MPARVEPLEARRLFVAISEVGLIDGPAPAPYSFTDPYSADAPPTTHYVGTGHGGTRRHPVEFAVEVKLGGRGDVLLLGGRPLSGTANSAPGATGFTISAWDYAGVGANSTTYTLQGKFAGGACRGPGHALIRISIGSRVASLPAKAGQTGGRGRARFLPHPY